MKAIFHCKTKYQGLRWTIQGVPHLSPAKSWDRLQPIRDPIGLTENTENEWINTRGQSRVTSFVVQNVFNQVRFCFLAEWYISRAETHVCAHRCAISLALFALWWGIRRLRSTPLVYWKFSKSLDQPQILILQTNWTISQFDVNPSCRNTFQVLVLDWVRPIFTPFILIWTKLESPKVQTKHNGHEKLKLVQTTQTQGLIRGNANHFAYKYAWAKLDCLSLATPPNPLPASVN